MSIRIAEIYVSRQGEGLLTGTPSVFVRTSGCNLRCSFCDTPFTSWQPEGRVWPLEQVMERVLALPERHVVLTGGEPMLPRDIVELTGRLRNAGRHITIETAGTVLRDVACDLMSVSPKLANSTPAPGRSGVWSARHEQRRLNLAVLRELVRRWNCQFKFVIAGRTDVDEVVELAAQIPEFPRERILLMPEGTDQATLARRETWLEPACAELGFRLCRRMHIEWYGHQRGT